MGPGRDRHPDHAGMPNRGGGRVTLKAVAEHLGLSPTTVSVVLNRSPVADGIPTETRERVFAAARELSYRPNLLARSLRGQRSLLLGLLVPEISEGYASGVMTGVLSGLEEHLAKRGYFYLIANHYSRSDLLADYLKQLKDRWVEGLILIATHLTAPPQLPAVVVSGHRRFAGVTNVVLHHDRATRLALSHLVELGHRRIAFFRGAEGNVDADDRWRAVGGAASVYGIEIRPEFALRLAGRSRGPIPSSEDGYREGYAYGQRLLAAGSNAGNAAAGISAGKPSFTALFAYNDTSAIGAMRAFQDAGLRVPEDVSVIGFDDIFGAAFQNPPLTTIRQPLAKMGRTAARILSQRLAGEAPPADLVTVEPELVVRASTGPAPRTPRR